MRSSRVVGAWVAATLAAVAVVVVPAAPAVADWLVTRVEGGGTAQVETRGPWEVKGRLVVFHTADGQLVSLRLEQVDLVASREATRRAVEATRRPSYAAAAASPREPVARRRITDADIPRGTAPPPPPLAEAGEQGSGSDEEAGAPERRGGTEALVVLTSRDIETADGHTRITGTLANHGQEPAVAVGLTVHLYDAEGEALASVAADVASSALPAGDVTSFIADFPEVYAYGATSFTPRGTHLATGAPESAPEPVPGDGASPP